ncbi:MAG TPA: hypothetical protein DCY03_14790 [Planctomycetaceae bacterium]|nr:hypothetical protein [Planctomycetaceae bacterium]|tara:strand:+ start:260 stop:568 length:309 start_codon:yes stop_codon:yes gene_type:complete
MRYSKTLAWLCICVLGISLLSTSQGNQSPQLPKEIATLSVIQTPEGPQLKIKVGDLVCTTSQLTVSRKQEEPWTVKPVGGQVEMRRGESVTKGPFIKALIKF